MLWALAKVKVNPGEVVMEQITAEVRSRVRVLPPLSISVIVKAFAKLKFTPHADLMNMLAVESSRRLNDFHMAEVANLLWGFDQLQWEDTVLLRQAEDYVAENVHLCTRHHVVSVVSSLRGLGYQPEGLVTVSRAIGFSV